MKTFSILILLMVGLAFDVSAQVQLREATAAEVAAGTIGVPTFVTPRRLAAKQASLLALTNGGLQTTPYGMLKNPNPKLLLVFGDSLSVTLRTNGWWSYGGITNNTIASANTNLANGAIFYNNGNYAANNISWLNVVTNCLGSYGYSMLLDTAASVPGQRGSDIWGTFNGSNYVALSSLEATKNTDQTAGFTYLANGLKTNLIHGDPLPLTFWPDSTNDVYITCQGITYTNSNNTPISLTVTGGSYVNIVFQGTPSYVTTAKITLPYRAGQGASSAYSAPYTTTHNAFDLTGNVPSGLWAISNAPSRTGISAAAIVNWGNNDTVITTNAAALFRGQTNFATFLRSNGIYPIILVAAQSNPNFTTAGVTITNLFTLQRAGWSNWFDAFYDMQSSNAINGLIYASTNYIDGTHPSTGFAGYEGTNAMRYLQWGNLVPPNANFWKP